MTFAVRDSRRYQGFLIHIWANGPLKGRGRFVQKLVFRPSGELKNILPATLCFVFSGSGKEKYSARTRTGAKPKLKRERKKQNVKSRIKLPGSKPKKGMQPPKKRLKTNALNMLMASNTKKRSRDPLVDSLFDDLIEIPTKKRKVRKKPKPKSFFDFKIVKSFYHFKIILRF